MKTKFYVIQIQFIHKNIRFNFSCDMNDEQILMLIYQNLVKLRTKFKSFFCRQTLDHFHFG